MGKKNSRLSVQNIRCTLLATRNEPPNQMLLWSEQKLRKVLIFLFVNKKNYDMHGFFRITLSLLISFNLIHFALNSVHLQEVRSGCTLIQFITHFISSFK